MTYVKGAYAGAIIGPLIWVLPLVVAIFISSTVGSGGASPPNPRGSWGTLILAMGGFVGTLVAVPVGAGLGLLIAWVEKRREQHIRRDRRAEDG